MNDDVIRIEGYESKKHEMLQEMKLVDRIKESIMITDRYGKILSVNRAFSEVTGYSQEEIVGNTPKRRGNWIRNTVTMGSSW